MAFTTYTFEGNIVLYFGGGVAFSDWKPLISSRLCGKPSARAIGGALGKTIVVFVVSTLVAVGGASCMFLVFAVIMGSPFE